MSIAALRRALSRGDIVGSRSRVDKGPIRSITGMHALTGARRYGRGPVLLLAAWTVAAGLALVSPKPAGAAQNVPTSWTGTGGPPQPVHEPSGPCLPGCSETDVIVDVHPSYWASVPGALEVRLCSKSCDQSPELADFDLHVYTVDANEKRLIASSAARASNAEETVYVGRPSGTYVVRVVTAAFLTADQLPELPKYEVKVAVREGVEFAARAMGLQCFKAKTWLTQEAWQAVPQKPAIPYDSCSGFVKRADHPPLYINIALPAGAMRPVPTIALLHGWTGTGGGWRATTADGCYGDDPLKAFCPTGSYHNNSPWFVTRGYAAISYSARGHGSSCGYDRDPAPAPEECTEGWTHIGERSAEAADTQHLLSVFVDANVADPDRLGATGGSYGGGQSWLLATALPWKTPGGRTLQLAAAAPSHGWTSFQNSLAPNGRATDGAEQRPDDLDSPYGVVKRGFVNELLTAGRKGAAVAVCSYPAAVVCPVGFVRYNDMRPDERHSHVAGWQAFWEAGEPYAPHGHVYTEAFRGKSAYHADDYLAELAARTVRPVPIFAVSGWTDFLFPAVETLQMYRRLKQADPRYPIWTVLDDSGHGKPGEQSPKEHVRSANDRRTAFFDRYLGGHDTDLGPRVVSKRSSCNGDPVDLSGVSGSSWDGVRGPEITLSLHGDPRTTSHPGRSAEIDGAGRDPFGLACAQAPAPGPGAASWTWPAPPGGATLLGLPTVAVDYALTGTDATLVAKLWDVAPDGGPRTLVTRGVYRLSEAAPTTTGHLSFQLFGNHWNFGAGHTVELELVQSDAPLFQADKLPSSLTLRSPSVRLPTARGS